MRHRQIQCSKSLECLQKITMNVCWWSYCGFTSFEQWPAYITRDNILEWRFILGFRFLARSATQRHITASKFGLFLDGELVLSNNIFKMGVYFSSSALRMLHLKDHRNFGSVCWRTESASHEHNAFTSLWIALPSIFNKCFLIRGFLKHWLAIFFLFCLATAFPKCLRRGVSL